MGFKQDVAEELQNLDRRVTDLEATASRLAGPAYRAVTGTAVRRQPEAPAARSGVDYGAVAFGLADMRRKLAEHLPSIEVNAQMRDAADWFAACFAGDPSFDAAEFTAKANG